MSYSDVVFYGTSTASGTIFVFDSTSTPSHIDIFYTNALLLTVAFILGIDLLRRVFGKRHE